MGLEIKGMDVSTLIEEEACGAVYFDGGVQGDALGILKKYGTNYVRLRLWNDPYDENGEPYGAGTNDLDKTITLAKRAKALGMKVLLDFHYSDFWADPGKQNVPKAWKNFTKEQLTSAVYGYTVFCLTKMRENGVLPDMVQVGNEITNGLLWPMGKKPDFDNIAEFVSSGIRGVRSVDSDIPVMLHLDNGGFNSMYVEWFDNYIRRGEDFEIIGLSYYPFWHGTLDELSYNMKDMAARYGKKIVVAEVSMGFSMEDYRRYEVPEEVLRGTVSGDAPRDTEPGDAVTAADRYINENLMGMATRPELLEKLTYPMTPEGQADFMHDVMKRIAEVPGGLGFFYWEPAWIPVPGCGWATEAALRYTGEKGPGGNEWANQALFDYEGNALPALSVISDF
ncbi:MAG: glycosyl hydrolase 53 family protein [Eubacterium sp.]|nr:glycosyl hydrolase 53 family protein [Eubacterium sp.]